MAAPVIDSQKQNSNGYYSGSTLEKMLRQGHFAVTAELGPPQSADGDVIRKKAALLRGFCDAVNITDNQTAIVRMSSIGAGVIAIQEGLEPVIQMVCRDRNRLAMQSDLLGAYALGARNLLCLTGDHQTFGNHPESKNVFDLGGEIEFWLEDEKYLLTRSCLIFVPAGMKHCPIKFIRIDRPIFHFLMVTGGQYA